MRDVILSISVLFLLSLSVVILNSIDKTLFPGYFGFIILAVVFFWFFSQIDFDIVSVFSNHFYIISILLLVLTLIIGRVTRGTVRWIPLGPFNLQPGEVVRPLLLVFFANYLTNGRLTAKKMWKVLALAVLPIFLILIQPSLGVSIVTSVGILGVVLASSFNKKYILMAFGIAIVLLPIFWRVIAPYQRQRLMTFMNPTSDPLGTGYNSLQSTIASGDGQILGRGLGEGIQTQLSFLPEKQTDFIFASVAEELGFLGATGMLVATFIILYRLVVYTENAANPAARAYLSGFFLTYLLQVFVHVGMDMGLLPVTGLPFPLVSAGGSSLLATMIGLGIALGAYKNKKLATRIGTW